ncbi:MAG: nucleotidyltransferase domain-containing protein [Candidatus Aenigmarchaeota archaeon]|nr:nucleotidyltransferase domain-containing protein [Candidatus Aenigmarchaeota archaeon]
MKKIEILEKIYLSPGIHLREICRQVNLGIPSVKNHLDKLLKNRIIKKKKEGRNLKFFVNFENRKVISYLSEVEAKRLENLPNVVGNSVFNLLQSLEAKPVITIIFGSYAKGDYTKESDLDVLLVFNRVEKEIEEKTKIVNSRYSVKISPVYLTWKEFQKKFFDSRDIFMREIKENKIIITGMEYWVMLENEKA